MRLSHAFSLIVDLALALGAPKPLNSVPGCWETSFGGWKLSLNGHDDETADSSGVKVAPCTAFVRFNDFPAGVIAPDGGCIAAGMFVNEEKLIRDLKARIVDVSKKST